MPKVRKNVADRWAQRAAMATGEYTDGINNPRNDWATATADAKDNYNLGIQQSIAAGRFESGVKNAGSAKWKDKALTKGPQRYSQGVQVSKNDFDKGIKPYLNVIESTTLPPRYPKGDPRNLERVRLMNETLRNQKLSTV